MKKQIIYICTLLLLFAAGSQAQTNFSQKLRQHNIDFEVKASFSIGGTSPLPLPEEIRSIESYDPTLSLSLGAQVTKWFNEKWGLSSGISFDTKAMKTKAEVKNYRMELRDGGGLIKGNWTGMVQTTVNNSYFTIPVMAAYRLSSIWSLRMGPYIAFLMDENFSGYVYDGYLREGDPTGPKRPFTGEETASYDFSDNLRNLQWGLQFGGSWKVNRHFRLNGDLQWGMNDIFHSDFNTITFNMYNVYLNIGFGYIF